MRTRHYITSAVLATSLLGIGACKQEAPPEPEPEPVVQVDTAAVNRQAAIDELIAERDGLTNEYTHTVKPGDNVWRLTKNYSVKGGNLFGVDLVDEVCRANGMEYKTLELKFISGEDQFTPIKEGIDQLNCNLIYPGQTLDMGPTSERLGELELQLR